MKRKQKHMKLLQRSLSWLLLLGTLLAAVAGNSLPVSASEADSQATYGKYKLSVDSLSKAPEGTAGRGSYYTRYIAEYSSDNRLFFYLHTYNETTGYRLYHLGALLDDGSCKYVRTLDDPVDFTLHSSRKITYKYSDDSMYRDWVWNGNDPDSAITTVLAFVVYSDDNFSTSGYVFESLSAAYSYFDRGDTSGLLQRPTVPPVSDDTDDGWLQDLIGKLEDLRDGAFGFFVEPFIAIAKGLQSIKNAILNLLPDRIKNILTGFFDITEGLARDTFGKVHDIYEFMKTKAAEFISFLTDIHSELVNISKGVWQFSWDLLPDAIKEKLQPFLDGISGLLDKLREGIDFLGQKFTDLIPSIKDIKDAIKNSRVASYLLDMKEMFDSFPGLSVAIQTFLDDPFGFIIGSAVKGFQNSPIGLLLLPSEEFIAKFMTDLREDFSGIFAIIDEVQKIINYMKTASGTKAPSFTINLGQSASYYLGESVTIDFSWYDAYKPTVDLLFAAIIWAGFLWRMYCRIPEIINGAGMTVTASYRIGRRGGNAD